MLLLFLANWVFTILADSLNCSVFTKIKSEHSIIYWWRKSLKNPLYKWYAYDTLVYFRLYISFLDISIKAVLIKFVGSETQDSSSEESSVYSDDNSTNDSQHAWSNKNYKSGKNACLHNLGEAQARKFKLMNSLVKILKLIDNGKIWIISSFVLIDKLSMIGDVIPSEDLHW